MAYPADSETIRCRWDDVPDRLRAQIEVLLATQLRFAQALRLLRDTGGSGYVYNVADRALRDFPDPDEGS